MSRSEEWPRSLDAAVELLPISLRSHNGSLATVDLLKDVFTEDDFELDLVQQVSKNDILKNRIRDLGYHHDTSTETLESLEKKLSIQGK
jgi:hypothetical protein